MENNYECERASEDLLGVVEFKSAPTNGEYLVMVSISELHLLHLLQRRWEGLDANEVILCILDIACIRLFESSKPFENESSCK